MRAAEERATDEAAQLSMSALGQSFGFFFLIFWTKKSHFDEFMIVKSRI